MDVKTFWELIESADGDGKRLATLLQENKPEEIRGFGDIIDLQFSKAYNWNLWAAAYLINGGCSEEEFDQFLYWLISLGEEKFENAMQDPDVLVDIVKENESTFNQEIIVAIARSLDRLGKDIDGKSNVTIPAELMDFKHKPRKPRGKEWKDDDELLEMFPKLGERFGEMLDWDEDEENIWDEEEKNKSKLRKAWDKFVGFFAGIYTWILKLFKKKKKGEEGEDEEEEEVDPNLLVTSRGVNFWLYLGALVLFLGFIALFPISVIMQRNINEEILVLQSLQTLNLQEYIGSWDYISDVIIERYIGILDPVTNKFDLWTLNRKIENWKSIQYLWGLLMSVSLVTGLPFIWVLLQHRFMKLNPKSFDFLNKKEEIKQTFKVKEIESIQLSRSNAIQIIPKKNSDEVPLIMIDMDSLKPLKKYCMEQKITTNEDSNILKMLYYQISDKIKRLKNR